MQAINFDLSDEATLSSDYIIEKRRGLPMCAGLRRDALRERFVSIHSDRDWQYPDRCMSWTLLDAAFKYDLTTLSAESKTVDDLRSSTELTSKLPLLSSPFRVSKTVRKAGDDYAIYNDRTTTRLAQSIPAGMTDFVVTYKLELTDLRIADKIDVEGFCLPDKAGEFTVTTIGGEFRYKIRLPKLLNENWEVVSQHTRHTLQKISETEYLYKKYPSAELTQQEIDASAWIDADVYYSSTADGRIAITSASWDTAHDAATGDTAVTGESYGWAPMAALDSGNYSLVRGFFYFDTSAVSGGVGSAVINLYDKYNANFSSVAIFTGTQAATLTIDDFDSYSGSELGYITTTSSGYIPITLDASAVVAGGTTKLCLRDRTYDVADSASSSFYGWQIYFSDQTGTDKDPYLEIETLSTASAVFMLQSHWRN